jgi:signal transduction histidine kinase
MLTFPSGKVYPPRWAPIVVLVAILKFIGAMLEILASPGRIKIFAPTLNPLFIPALAPFQPVIAMTIGIAGLLVPIILLAGLISLILRYRASPVTERQRLKWIIWGFSLLVPIGATTFALIFRYGFTGMPFQILYAFAAGAQALFLASIAISLLRYRLFDIDILINRTLVYGVLTAVIIGIYVLVVGGFSALLQNSNTIAPLLLTAVISAVCFQPLRARLQRAADTLIPIPAPGAAEAMAGAAPAAPEAARAQLGQPWLAAARFGWLSLATLVIVILLASIPAYINQLGLLTPAERLRLAVAGQPLTAPDPLEFWLDLANMIGQLASAAACLALGAVIFRRRSNERMAILISFFLPLYGVIVGGPLQTLVEWRADWFAVVGTLAALLFAGWAVLFYLFPDGQFTPAWTRWLTLAFIPWLLATLFFKDYFVATTTSQPGPIQVMVLAAWYMFWPVTSLAAQIQRYRRVSNYEQRQQTKWVMLAFGLFVLVIASLAGPFFYFMFKQAGSPLAGMPALARFYGPVWSILVSLAPISMGVAILRYHLFDIDLLIHRTLVYGVLTAMVVGLYVIAVGLLGALFQTSGSLIISLLATGLVAILFQPLRARLQMGVNRLMFGDRDDPYAVLSRLGQRLESALAPDLILPTITETVAQALKLPYAAIRLNGNPLITHGHPPPGARPEAFALVYQGETVGQLEVAPRAADEPFSQAERRLLTDIAHQAGVAAHAVRLTADLQRSRERLITAREEERRRLRRDLHDGLGPKLAGQSLKLEAARDALETRPPFSRSLLDELIGESQTLVAEIRRLVYALRPPVLDDLGLIAAVRQQAASSELNGLQVTVTAPPVLPPLPAAIEAAAYRIVQEALTNVIRHAHAHRCSVQLTLAESVLHLEILDDGVGLAGRRPAGVGLASMRERAEEIGGACVIEAGAGGGSRVAASLPLPKG